MEELAALVLANQFFRVRQSGGGVRALNGKRVNVTGTRTNAVSRVGASSVLSVNEIQLAPGESAQAAPVSGA